jgi:hypothetical protein
MSRFGVALVAGSPYAFDSVNLSVGYSVIDGGFAGSYVDVGWGKNELYAPGWSRLRVDSLLSVNLSRHATNWPLPSLFIEILSDTDTRSGPDTVRTFLGAGLDISSLFRRRAR